MWRDDRAARNPAGAASVGDVWRRQDSIRTAGGGSDTPGLPVAKTTGNSRTSTTGANGDDVAMRARHWVEAEGPHVRLTTDRGGLYLGWPARRRRTGTERG